MSLAELGCTVKRTFNSSQFQLNGVTLGGGETTTLTIALPRVAAVQGTFSKEGVAKKIFKLFTRELQTGDAAFDSAIYISTDTPEATQAFLASERVRAIIAENIGAGGPISVEGQTLTAIACGHDEGEPGDLVELVRALLV